MALNRTGLHFGRGRVKLGVVGSRAVPDGWSSGVVPGSYVAITETKDANRRPEVVLGLVKIKVAVPLPESGSPPG
jgi:hypothetical protein